MDRCTKDTEHFLSRFADLTRETAAHATQVFPFLDALLCYVHVSFSGME